MYNTVYEQNNEDIHDDAKFSIGDLAKMLGCNKSLLRYYEEQFSLQIPRSKSNRRYYTIVEAEKFRYILKLKDSGLSNKEIKTVLESERIGNAGDSFSEEAEPSVTSESTYDNEDKQELSALFEIIAGLRDEINELKKAGMMKDKSELVAENEQLRQRLKEKTYELVSLREDIRLNTKKKRFFR
ncbi:MAG: MerR family transcriptional regulator [Anaerofustis stercorihominis]|nr:MerR family transcriptional regulator [Anaerofustis stercorihominis]